MNSLLDKIIRSALEAAIPQTSLTVSRWAENYRYVSAERSARPGRWSNDLLPFLNEIMDEASNPATNRIIFQKSSQVGGSECLNNILGYRIHIDPTMMMYVAETETKAKAWAFESFDTMVSATPVLSDLVAVNQAQSRENNYRRKKFRGGLLTIAFASSPAELSSRPVEVICLDEVDAMVATNEGNPVALAEARTKTFNETRKIILVSSPRLKETSIIEREYLASDQRQYFVPCPDCKEFQTLKWAQVFWEENPKEACYICEHCGVMIDHSNKEEMLSKGKWIAGEKFTGIAGFKINELYSPFTTWGDMAADFLEAKKFRDTLQVFVNTRLGETWEDEGDKLEFDDISFKREEYEWQVPTGVLILTAGVDVQGDRLECEIVGWGIDNESWSIEHKVIYGSPSLPSTWDLLADFLQTEFDSPRGAMKVLSVCIDSGGHHSEMVYKFTKANAGRRWFAVKGWNISGKPLIAKPSLVGKQKVKLFMVGTDAAKDEIFSFLRVEKEGSPGYCHFPHDREESYFKQLCSEKKITKYVQGVARQTYVKIKEGMRNEALDLRVYATAAREILSPNFQRIAVKLPILHTENTILEEKELNTEIAPKKQKIRRISKGLSALGANWR